MAVAVEGTPHLVLDECYRIAEVGPAAAASFGALVGRELWEAFPDSSSLFRPYYELARRTGDPVELVQFYDGRLWSVRATPAAGRLLLHVELVCRLDTLTLETLRSSLAAIVAAVEDAEARLRRRSLHVLRGEEA